MSKLILVLSLIPVVVGVGMELQDGMTQSPQAPEMVRASRNLLLLDNGAFVEARDGSVEFTHEWMDVTWRFINAEHRDLSAADPKKYAPAYGG